MCANLAVYIRTATVMCHQLFVVLCSRGETAIPFILLQVDTASQTFQT